MIGQREQLHCVVAPTEGERCTTRPAFISYAHQDFYFAASPALRLSELDVVPWPDPYSILPGSDWEKVIHDGRAIHW